MQEYNQTNMSEITQLWDTMQNEVSEVKLGYVWLKLGYFECFWLHLQFLVPLLWHQCPKWLDKRYQHDRSQITDQLLWHSSGYSRYDTMQCEYDNFAQGRMSQCIWWLYQKSCHYCRSCWYKFGYCTGMLKTAVNVVFIFTFNFSYWALRFRATCRSRYEETTRRFKRWNKKYFYDIW